ncbi:MAG: DUF6311 domain-containing protein [Candidatus Korobacteraceae bacterium]
MNRTQASLTMPQAPDSVAILAPVVRSTTSRAPERLRWLDAVWLQLTISAIVGFLFALLVMGRGPLNPRNIGWLGEDGSQHYIGWELLRQDPHWHWPLMYTNRFGYPVGDSVALVDVNPWMALPFKLLSPLLPEPFQYFGIEAILVCALQFFFAVRLFRLLLGANILGVVLAGLFFLIAPPLTFRLKFHYCLSNHWLLLAALLVFFQAQQESPNAVRRFVISALIVAGLGIATNPYIAFQVFVVMAAAAGSLLWKEKLSLRQAAGFMVVMGLTCVLIAYSLGFIIAGGRGYGGHGYRIYSMNLLAPFDPGWFGSTVFPALVPQLEKGQYEGFSYLGAGVIILALIVLLYAFLRRDKLRVIDRCWLLPLLSCCVLLTLMALTTKVVAGNRTILDVDPRQLFSRLFAPLRSSGRLFWTPYYAILTGLLAAPYLFMRRSRANALLACLLIVQFADTIPLRHWTYAGVHKQFPEPLKSPVWHQLGSVYENLIVLPAWQCGPRLSPGGAYGYRYFGYLATEQKMRTNSYYTARYTGNALDYHCEQSLTELTSKPLLPDSAYVVTPEVAAEIARGPTGDGKCHELDGFILCSPKTDFGLSSKLKDQGAPVAN